MGKTEDCRQPITRHVHQKEPRRLARKLARVIHLRGDWYPAKETNEIMGQTKMAGVLTFNLTTFSPLNLYTDKVANLTQQDLR